MTTFAIRPEELKDTIMAVLGDRIREAHIALGELTVVVPAGPCVAADKVIPIDIYDATLAKQTVTLRINNTNPAVCP